MEAATLARPAPDEPVRLAARAETLRRLGADDAEAAELLGYTGSVFVHPAHIDLPLADEPFVADWRAYAARAQAEGVLPVLRAQMVQLRFPIAEGVSVTAEYQAAIRRGALPATTDDLRLEAPASLRLFIHPTPAGGVPVLLAPHRADFESLARALTRKN